MPVTIYVTRQIVRVVRSIMATLAADNIIAFLNGTRPPTPVNPEVLREAGARSR
jgi:hypothetical protein